MDKSLSTVTRSERAHDAAIVKTRPMLNLHGFPGLSVPGLAQPLRLRHALALLARLHESNRPVARDALAALLWPDAALLVGRARLRRLIHELHVLAGQPIVAVDGDTLRLQPGCHSDLALTRRAMGAVLAGAQPLAAVLRPLLAPGRAAMLDGFTLGSETFDDWLDGERRSHRAAWTAAVEAGARRAVDEGDAVLAEAAATALLRDEPCNEAAHAARMAARALGQDAAGVESAYFDCAERMRSELGVRPSPRLEQAYRDAVARAVAAPTRPAIAYAQTRHGQVAHAAWGSGDDTIVVMWGLVSNVEVALEEPRARKLLDALAERHRVVLLDRRGCGLSERVGVHPSVDTAVEDVTAVLDHVGARRAWLFGSSAGGTLALEFALRHPQRTAGLLLYGTSATGCFTADAPWGLRAGQVERWVDRLSNPGHYAESLGSFAPSAAGDPWVREWYARLLRNATTRLGAAEMLRVYRSMDLRDRLPALAVPTLVMQRRGDRVVPMAAGRQLASLVPHAELLELPGDDHFLWHGDSEAVWRAASRFVGRHAERLAA